MGAQEKSENALGLAILGRARADLSVREASRNAGPRIAEYAKNFGLTPPLNWCAVAVCTWIKEACADLGRDMPIEGSPAAKGVMAQLIERGFWTPKVRLKCGLNRLHLIYPGDIAVWHRGPKGAWTGHIGIVDSIAKGELFMLTIEGNSGPKTDQVALMRRTLTDPLLLGTGHLT